MLWELVDRIEVMGQIQLAVVLGFGCLSGVVFGWLVFLR